MVEYETTKPLLVSFNRILDYIRIHGEYNGALIVREALKNFSLEIIVKAVKGKYREAEVLKD